MLITFSGMVGSGKSTHSKNVIRLLRGFGYSPYLIHFRQIGWRHLLRSSALPRSRRTPPTSPRKQGETSPPAPQVRLCQSDKQWSLIRFFGYLLYIFCFRLFLLLHHRQHLLILNRYFYDNFAHFRIATWRDRLYLRVLLAVVPKPDLAFLLVVHPENAHRRRPTYALEALRQMAVNYGHLQQFVNGMILVITDDMHGVDGQENSHLRSEGWFIRSEDAAHRSMLREAPTTRLAVQGSPAPHPTELALRAVLSNSETSD